VFLLEPNATPYDLRWRMFGIPVRVHPMFWLVTLIMGWNAIEHGLPYLLIWIGCVFVSILVHELGHVCMGLIFGAHGHIVLYSFGGLAIGSSHLHHRGRRIAVFFAGPLAGFLLLGTLFLLLWIRDPEVFPAFFNMARWDLGLAPLPLGDNVWEEFDSINPLQVEVIHQLIYINLLWGLVNLLPVWPLDGGQISRDVCEGLSRERGLTVSLGISLVMAGLVAVYFLATMKQSAYGAIMFALLALYSFQLLQQAHSQRRWTDDHWHDRNDW
jgi:stage IV sporulation protein FB